MVKIKKFVERKDREDPKMRQWSIKLPSYYIDALAKISASNGEKIAVLIREAVFEKYFKEEEKD